MADEKWIDGLVGDMPAHEAAQLALAVRLTAVRDRLPDAALHSEDDIEHVHQLRVNTRRAAAALRLFADCLPDRLAKKTRQSLKAIRRSAGAARDWDVFLEMLDARRGQHAEKRGLDFLIGYAHGQRVLAQEHLHQAHDENADKFAQRIEQVKEALDSAKFKMTLAELAVPMLTELLRELESAAAGDLQEYEALHQVRILGKQLRYAMEIFASCFEKEFRERYYPAVEEMQDILGLANDSHTARLRLEAMCERLQKTKHWTAYRAAFAALIALHEKRLGQQRRKFERWWKRWLKSGAESAFAELIRGS